MGITAHRQGKAMRKTANSILCIIPARGGSKRIPKKNLRLLGGKPLICHTIEAALKSGVFSQIVVSSDDKKILSTAEQMGVVKDCRPDFLCGDKVKAVEVVAEYLLRDENANKFNITAMLLPTCPFRSPFDIKTAANNFLLNKKCHFLISVTEYDFPPQFALEVGKNGAIIMKEPGSYIVSTRSQDQKTYYHPNGAVYIAKTNYFLRDNTFFGKPLLSYIMPKERSFDIDYPYQFRIAECMIQGKEVFGKE